ncbi:class I SAM-dependent methyltransferase [Actinoplanes sp. CA-030573]|uniref:class I SAM-dependent methyltransferase n=1 Tax=Actinoplanes sp. CA-030573 TaxID=3239898 RepID=UPI003D94E5DA
MTSTPSARAVQQYAGTTGNLTARIALHSYGTNPQDWFAWLAARLPAAGEVLEAGAGTGKLWTQVAHDRLRLTLTDFSPAMCAQLATVPGARVVRCDASGLPFAEAGFDTVIANHMLYHVDDPLAALREFARVLRPGGRVAVATNGRHHLAELDEVGAAIGRGDLGQWRFQNDFSAETGPGLVGQVFRDVRVERYPCDLRVPAAAPVLAYLESMAAGPLSAPERSAVQDIVQARIAADGVFRVRKHTVLITAVR